jgi:hypothetical protein
MSCPRCGETLATFTVEATDGSADVCESCGFVGVAASHHSEADGGESWAQARERFDETVVPAERTCRTERGEVVTAPTGDAGPGIDPERLDESVPVGSSLRDGRDEENDDDETG